MSDWIRVEDKLPPRRHEAFSHSEDVLVTIENKNWLGDGTSHRYVDVGTLFYTSSGATVWLNEDWSPIEDKDMYVIGWMPFPEPMGGNDG